MPEQPYKTQETTTDRMITELYANMLLKRANADDNQFIEAKNLDMQSKTISDLLDPTANQDAATKKYVDDNLVSYIKVSDFKTPGTDGGTFTQDAWQTRDINREDTDTGDNCSISSKYGKVLTPSSS